LGKQETQRTCEHAVDLLGKLLSEPKYKKTIEHDGSFIQPLNDIHPSA